MNKNNFLVRPHLELVERFRTPEAWDDVSLEELAALNERVAKLPDQLDPENEDAKRFDVLVLNAQLGLLQNEPFERQRKRVIDIGSALEELGTAIPVVAQQMELIIDIQADQWWVNVSYPMLEDARRRLRGLVHLIERVGKTPLYSDFTDALGESTEIELPGTGGRGGSPEFAQFRKKAQRFLTDNLANEIVSRVRSGEPITPADMDELQRVLVASGIGDDDTFAQASERAGSFGLFVRSLVGLDVRPQSARSPRSSTTSVTAVTRSHSSTWSSTASPNTEPLIRVGSTTHRSRESPPRALRRSSWKPTSTRFSTS